MFVPTYCESLSRSYSVVNCAMRETGLRVYYMTRIQVDVCKHRTTGLWTQFEHAQKMTGHKSNIVKRQAYGNHFNGRVSQRNHHQESTLCRPFLWLPCMPQCTRRLLLSSSPFLSCLLLPLFSSPSWNSSAALARLDSPDLLELPESMVLMVRLSYSLMVV